MTKLSVVERNSLALMSIDELVAHARSLGLADIGNNDHLLLDEFARRLELSTDAISLSYIEVGKRDIRVWLWASYSEERIARFRQTEGRKWNSTCHCNSFTFSPDSDPTFTTLLCDLYTKSIVITESEFRIVSGESPDEWLEEKSYGLSAEIYKVNLGEVLSAYATIRPDDSVRSVGLHGEVDPEYRNLFGAGVAVADAETHTFCTRHGSLIFRLLQTDAQPRYLVYSAKDKKGVEVFFGNSSKAQKALARFKEAQYRIGYPLIEQGEATRNRFQGPASNSGPTNG